MGNELGPHVYLNYTQAELDDAYDQAVWAPNRDHVHQRGHAAAARARERLGEPRRLSYGDKPAEFLELFRCAQTNAPVLVFVHGGAWRTSDVSRFSYLAEPFVNAGAHVAILQFDGVEQVDGRLMVLADQVRRGIAWVYRHAPSFGGDPSRLHVAGHSSGAHLTSAALIADWPAYGVPPEPIAGALCCSGMYDLEPVALSKRSSYVRFDAEVVDGLSALKHLDRLRTPLVVAYGTCESPEFMRQGRDFVAALERRGHPHTAIVGTGYNHFELIETLGNPYGLLGAALLEQMALAELRQEA